MEEWNDPVQWSTSNESCVLWTATTPSISSSAYRKQFRTKHDVVNRLPRISNFIIFSGLFGGFFCRANTNWELGNSNQTSSSNSTEPRNRSLLRIEKPPERGSSTRSVSEPSRPAEASNFSTITPEIFAAEQFENEASIEESHNTVIIEEVKPDDVLKVEAEWDQIREDAKNDAYVRLEPQKKDASEGTTTFELKNAFLNKSDENDIHDEAVNGITKNDEFDNAGHESRMSTATTNTQFYDALSDVEDSGMPEGMGTVSQVVFNFFCFNSTANIKSSNSILKLLLIVVLQT